MTAWLGNHSIKRNIVGKQIQEHIMNRKNFYFLVVNIYHSIEQSLSILLDPLTDLSMLSVITNRLYS